MPPPETIPNAWAKYRDGMKIKPTWPWFATWLALTIISHWVM